jgi:Fe(3+) dicitrate transport protein
MRYLAQQPGGLTDAQFARDARQSSRARNWFQVDWNLFALHADYSLSSRSSLNTRLFGLLAGRDALGNLGRIDRIDAGGPRDLLVDRFRNWGNETRLLVRYGLAARPSVLVVGGRYYAGWTRRRQGEGPDGADADFVYANPDLLEGSDFDLPSRNASLFAENVFNLSDRVSLTPGVRLEHIRTEARGYYRQTTRDLAGNVLSDERIDETRRSVRTFAFFGLGASVRGAGWEAYANLSQNYRAITFNDLRVQVGSLQVDPDLRDERGYNADVGVRGAWGRLSYDATLFHLAYRDRIGTVLRTEPNPQFNGLVDRTFRLRTNLADASIWGAEALAEWSLWRRTRSDASAFVNLALTTAAYDASAPSTVAGNEVELVPGVNVKTGASVRAGALRVAAQLTHVGAQFSDASNAQRVPSAIEGVIPAYTVADVSAEYEAGRFGLEAGVTNVADARYFTRRATGYPGPGILPAEGRSLYATLTVTL